MELISIIMPVHNSEKYLNDTIESVIRQTYKKWELVIINDGSTDSSESICKKYCKEDKRIILYNKNNEGVSKARNYGLEKAKGKYIMFLDSDDLYQNNMIEKMYQKMKEEDVDIVKANYKIKNKDGIIVENHEIIKEKKYKKEDIKTELLDFFLTEKQHCYIWALLLKKDLIEKFNEKLFIFEDFDFYLNNFLKVSSVYVMQETLYIYNKDNINSLTKKNIEKNITNMILANIVLKNSLDKYNLLTRENINKLDTRIIIDIINYIYAFQINRNMKETKIFLNKILQHENIQKMIDNFDTKYATKKERIFTEAAIKKRYLIFFLLIIIKNIKNKQRNGRN